MNTNTNVIPVDFQNRTRARKPVTNRHVQFATFTDRGRARANNEDRYLANEVTGLYVVADGLGGHEAGEVAAQLAVDTIDWMVAQSSRPYSSDDLARAFAITNERIYQRGQQDVTCRGMGTTAVAMMLLAPPLDDPPGAPVRVAITHSGDSRAYVAQRKPKPGAPDTVTVGLYALTKDHEQDGLLTAALGMGPSTHSETRVWTLTPGDTVLLCTDGLYREINDARIVQILGALAPVEDIAQHLCAEALACGGRDNVTGIVIRV